MFLDKALVFLASRASASDSLVLKAIGTNKAMYVYVIHMYNVIHIYIDRYLIVYVHIYSPN